MSEKKKGGFKGPSLYLTIGGGMTFADYSCPYDCGDMRPCPYVQGWVDPMDEDYVPVHSYVIEVKHSKAGAKKAETDAKHKEAVELLEKYAADQRMEREGTGGGRAASRGEGIWILV